MDFAKPLNNLNSWLAALPSTIKTSPRDEQIAYGCILAGSLVILATLAWNAFS